jgi:hypothetical protein
MANTGFIINNTVRQYFTSGPNSGSTVNTGSDVNLTVSPFSASLENETFFYRVLEPEICPEGFETCLSPLLTSINTGSQRGRFSLSYVTQSSFNTASAITASVSNDINFSIFEVFSASIDTLVPLTTSFVSGTVYFKAFTSCSGPDPSPDSSLLSFTYDLLPQVDPGDVQIIFKNNYSSTMQVEIRSLRGNANYLIKPKESLTYDYTNSPEPGAWTAEGKSEDLNITIKGGAISAYGNYIQRITSGVNKETYTTGGGFNNPLTERENSNNFAADRGISFTVRQLQTPTGDTPTITVFTLLENTPPPPPASIAYVTSPSHILATDVCNDTTTSAVKLYLEGSNTIPSNGLIVYTNKILTIPYVGDGSYIGFDLNIGVTPPTYAVAINASGIITDVFSCPDPPLPPPPPVPPPPGPVDPPEPTISPDSIFGSTPFSSELNACSNLTVNFREKQYWHLDNYLYDNLSDAESKTKTIFPFNENYIITSRGTYLIVNKEGYVTNLGTCRFPTITLYTLRGSFSSQFEACKQRKTSTGSNIYTENGSIPLRSGRYPIFNGEEFRAGGTNAIISNGQVIAIETCGSEMDTIEYSNQGFSNVSYPLATPELVNPFLLQRVCNWNNFTTYYIGPDDLIYYDISGDVAYVPLKGAASLRWYKTPGGSFDLIDNGQVTDTVSPC